VAVTRAVNCEALYAALSADQQKLFDRRIVQALREPLGTS
jgi:hypothetical protein